MDKHEIANILENIDESRIPAIITDQFSSLQALRKNVAESTKKAKLAQSSAQQAKDKSAGFFHKKEAIESLQNATADLADAQISSAQAQEVSFEYQQKLGEITKFLFGLGVSNIAMNRIVVRELEMKLKGASEEELGELARQEIVGVLKQLKAQEDIMKKQSNLTNKVKNHEIKLAAYDLKDKEHDILIADNQKKTMEHDKLLVEKARKDKRQDEEIARQAAKDDELSKRIDEGEQRDRSQDEEIARQAAKDDELGRRIDEGEQKDKSQDEEIARQAAKDDELGKRIDESEQRDKSQDEEIARQAAKDDELGRRIDEGEQRDKSQDEEIARQAAKDDELGKRIDEGEEKDKSQDKEIARQAARDEELDQMISKLMQLNKEKETQIKELKAICENLSSKIESGIEHVDNVESGLTAKLNEKAGKNENMFSYAIGIIALLVAFLQFFTQTSHTAWCVEP